MSSPAHPNAMPCMTTTAGMVQKAARGRSKSPPLAVKKQLIISPSLTLPKGREFILAVFEEVVMRSFPLGKAGMGLPYSYSARVAISRRRYHSRNSSLCYSIYMTLPIGNKVIIFLYRRSRTFFTANGGFLYLRLFSLPSGRRGWGWRKISESSLSR